MKKTSLIILDGARGAGKSTVSGLLAEKIKMSRVIGLDAVRNLIKESKATDNFNSLAFETIYQETIDSLVHGRTVIIDSGLIEERVNKLKEIALSTGVEIYLYYLSAPKSVLWERITKRGRERNRMPNPERFEYTYKMQQGKDFSDFVEIDTTSFNVEEIAQQIYSQTQIGSVGVSNRGSRKT